MGANAQIAVPSFTAGQVLTAAQQTQINTGIPVFATTTTRDAAFGGTGEKVLAEGQYAYIEATSSLMVYSGSAWINAISSGLNLITAQTIGSAVGSVAVSNVFSATYDTYKIIVSGGVGSTANVFNMTIGASATTYYYQMIFASYNATIASDFSSNGAAWSSLGGIDTTALTLNMDINNPFLAKYTTFQAACTRTTLAGTTNGIHQTATSYTGFTLTPASGTITGGTVYVFGYAKA